MQQELNRIEAQLHNMLTHQALLAQLPPIIHADTIRLGSYVRFSDGREFVIATGIGRIRAAGPAAYLISADSPLGEALLGRSYEQPFVWQGKTFQLFAA